MSDRIAVFNDGTISRSTCPTELYEPPATRFVAGFIGENNRLDGTVREVYGGRCRVELKTGQYY